MTFDDWVTSIFDHPATNPEWHWDPDASFWDGPPTAIVDYMTRLFADAEIVLSPYSDAQAAIGLQAVISNGPTDYPFMLLDASVPLRSRLDCIGAMELLFSRYFALRCSLHLSHLDTRTPPHVSPLNGVCYMWWDVLPLHGLSQNRPDVLDGPELDRAILSVIRHCLEIDAVACQESALLGLFEWSPYNDDTNEIADDFLSRHPDFHPDLRAFAVGYL